MAVRNHEMEYGFKSSSVCAINGGAGVRARDRARGGRALLNILYYFQYLAPIYKNPSSLIGMSETESRLSFVSEQAASSVSSVESSLKHGPDLLPTSIPSAI
ncbi:hypothetical protein TorRG33x02_345050 [Trema orientale]|uniref:Uncharacterized protein n=1 Tax=Trema orientale TaxID=63057 RepID=A0A2P5APR3_TREOI|nr:hypothetical protein TorRG33x02_345050 [Trema orientale]